MSKKVYLIVTIMSICLLVGCSIGLVAYLNQSKDNQSTNQTQSNYTVSKTSLSYQYSTKSENIETDTYEANKGLIDQEVNQINKYLSSFKQIKEYEVKASTCQTIQDLNGSLAGLNQYIYTIKKTETIKTKVQTYLLYLNPLVINCVEHVKGSTDYIQETKKLFSVAQENIKEPFIFKLN